MKLKRISLLGLLGCMLFSCGPSINDDTKEEPKFGYNDLYQGDKTMRPIKTGKSIYRASDGYIQNEQQGYNNFYYCSLKGSTYEEMKYEKDQFVNNDSFIKNGVMSSSKELFAARKFVAPISGKTKISGQIKSLSDKDLLVEIYINSNLLISSHSLSNNGIYVEKIVDVVQGDNIYFVLKEEGQIEFNPSIDFINAEDALLHQNIDGEYGDVHPFYDMKNKKMYMYYLSTGREVNSAQQQFTTLATVSDDMVNFKQVELSRNKVNPPAIDTYYALGVYEDAEGMYRSCFGQGNHVGTSKSKDLLYWENGKEDFLNEETGMLDYHHVVNFGSDVYSGRDPFIYYDKEEKTYYCIVMNYYSNKVDKGSKGLAIYKGDVKGDYSKDYYKALDTTSRGDPECPELFKINDRYYIFYSIYGTGTSGNVGKLAYRIGDIGKNPLEVDWNHKKELYLDGGDLHAAQLCNVGDMFYMYGWLTSAPHINSWGGTLNISREVFQRTDGTLGSRIDPEYKKHANKGKIYSFNDMKKGKFQNAPRCIVNSKIVGNGMGFTGQKVISRGVTYYIGLTKTLDKDYLVITRDINKYDDFISLEINEKKENYNLEIYLDGGYVEAFVNDEYGVSGRMLFNNEYDLELINTNNQSSFTSIDLYRLSQSNEFLE